MKKSSRKDGPKSFTDRFSAFARGAAVVLGSPWACITALLVIVVWGVTGPLFGYSDTWQLVINTSTTIVTFIMVFIIQNTQNRDSKALHLKLDEVIRAARGARKDFVDLEGMDDEELETLADEFAEMHERERNAFKKHGHDLSSEADG